MAFFSVFSSFYSPSFPIISESSLIRFSLEFFYPDPDGSSPVRLRLAAATLEAASSLAPTERRLEPKGLMERELLPTFIYYPSLQCTFLRRFSHFKAASRSALLTISYYYALSSVETNYAFTKVFLMINSSLRGLLGITLLRAAFSFSFIIEAGASSQVSEPLGWPLFILLSYQV